MTNKKVAKATKAVAEQRMAVIRHRAGEVLRCWEVLAKEVEDAYAARDWEVLEFNDWEDYCDSLFFELRPQFQSTLERWKTITSMSDAGMSTRAIAAATGASQSTVTRTVREAESDDSPGTTTGTDGKKYPAKKPAEKPAVSKPATTATPAAKPNGDETDWNAVADAMRPAMEEALQTLEQAMKAYADLVTAYPDRDDQRDLIDWLRDQADELEKDADG